MASAIGAVLLAAVALNRERLRPRFIKASLHWLNRGLDPIRALHSGAVGDYVTWLVVGVTVLGGLFAVVVR